MWVALEAFLLFKGKLEVRHASMAFLHVELFFSHRTAVVLLGLGPIYPCITMCYYF